MNLKLRKEAVLIVREMLPTAEAAGVDIDSAAFIDICNEHGCTTQLSSGRRMVNPETVSSVQMVLNTIADEGGFSCLAVARQAQPTKSTL